MVQAMKLKNILIVVNDIQESICFYKEIFGLDIITKQEGNVILTEGLVLQDAKVWADVIEKSTTPYNNMTELYFEDNDVEGLVDKLISRNILVKSFLIASFTCKCIININNRYHLCGVWYFFTFQSIRIALSIPSFMIPPADFPCGMYQ